MKANELRQIIREIVTEEVQREVADQVNRSMARLLGEVLNQRNTSKKVVNESTPAVPVKKKPYQQYTSNPELNKILNETAEESEPLPKDPIDFKSMVGLESPIQNEDVVLDMSSKMNMLKSIVGREPAKQSITESSKVPDVLKDVFKRDFRQVVKAANEKAQGYRGGGLMVNPRDIIAGGFEQV